MTRPTAAVAPLFLFLTMGCGGDPAAPLTPALTFHASFDQGLDADLARGDRRIYSAPSYDELDQRKPGYWGENIESAYGEGRFGDALRFNSKNVEALFFSAKDNVAFSPEGWSGTASFWLRLDPAVDLEPGYCDPIQITDSAYNDNAIWVDFTQEYPRQFRLGVFGELDEWNPAGTPPDQNPDFMNRLVVVSQPPFSRGKWTHVVISYRDLGGGEGEATLYLDGESRGVAAGVVEPFGWDLEAATIRLGVNYVGLFDELAIFDRPLDDDEVRLLRDLPGGVADLR